MNYDTFTKEVTNALETLSKLKQTVYDATVELYGELNNEDFYNNEFYDTFQAVQDKIGQLWAWGITEKIECGK